MYGLHKIQQPLSTTLSVGLLQARNNCRIMPDVAQALHKPTTKMTIRNLRNVRRNKVAAANSSVAKGVSVIQIPHYK